MSYAPTEALKKVVMARAAGLKNENKGYLETVNIITKEIYNTAKGKDTAISRLAPATLTLNIPVKEIIRVLIEMLRSLPFFKDLINRKRMALEEIRKMIEPWVSEVFLPGSKLEAKGET
jgi:hypothetical protein